MAGRNKAALGALSIALTVGLVVACGGGAATSSATGEVSLAITDTPLSQLQTLTLEISRIDLLGAGTPDYTVFTANAGTPAMSVDLLGLQGLSQVLSNAAVPVGLYHSVELTYQNPSATATSGAAVTVNHSSNTLLGLFAPPLHVTTNTAQAVQIDLNLKHSVIDTGPGEVFLAPAVLARVLGQGQSIPIQRLHGIVQGTDIPNDRFVMAIRRRGGARPGHGQIRVQCSAQTTLTDASGNVTTGGVTAQLSRGDLVDVDGVLRGGVIDADAVTLLGQPSPGPVPMPHVAQIAGTLHSIDTANHKIAVIVDRAFGSGAPLRFTKVDIDVATGAHVFRGRTALTGIGDLVLGNYMHVMAARLTGGGFQARAIREGPSRIAGTIDSIVTGGATGSGLPSGTDRVTFTWTHLNQVASTSPHNLSAIWNPVRVDLPTVFHGNAGDPIRVVAFFEAGTNLLTLPVHIGPVPPNPVPGPIGPPIMRLVGTVTSPPSPSLNGSGDIEFDLDLRGRHGTVRGTVHVTIDKNATMVKIDGAGQRTPLTATEAVTALQASPLVVEVEGSNPPSGSGSALTYTADLALRIVTARPNGGGGGGGGGTGFPGPTHADVRIGGVVGAATLNATTNEITFQLNLAGGMRPGPAIVIDVTVTSGARLRLWQHGSHPSTGQPSTLTPQDAVDELNKSPRQVVVAGTANGSQFTADRSLGIFP